MKVKSKLIRFLLVLLIALTGCSINSDKQLIRRFTKSLEKFAETVLENGRDQYGKVSSPLFVDGLHLNSLEPAKWQFCISLQLYPASAMSCLNL